MNKKTNFGWAFMEQNRSKINQSKILAPERKSKTFSLNFEFNIVLNNLQ